MLAVCLAKGWFEIGLLWGKSLNPFPSGLFARLALSFSSTFVIPATHKYAVVWKSALHISGKELREIFWSIPFNPNVPEIEGCSPVNFFGVFCFRPCSRNHIKEKAKKVKHLQYKHAVNIEMLSSYCVSFVLGLHRGKTAVGCHIRFHYPLHQRMCFVTAIAQTEAGPTGTGDSALTAGCAVSSHSSGGSALHCERG